MIVGLIAGAAHAQQAVVASPRARPRPKAAGPSIASATDHYIRKGDVQIDLGDTKIYADEVEFFTDQNRVIATGNVVVSQANSRIAADRAEFDTKTKLGTFYNAWGMAPLGPQKTRRDARTSAALAGGLFGSVAATAIASQALTADTDVYFFGETIEKLGPKKYRITNGGFTTCVQPTPRWELHSSTVVLNLDDYTAAAQRGVPGEGRAAALHAVPVLPDQAGGPRDRLPAADLRVDLAPRPVDSQRLLLGHRPQPGRHASCTTGIRTTAQGVGSEYRYNFGPGSNGNLKSYWLDQNQSTDESGADACRPSAATSCAARPTRVCRAGSAPGRNVNYFSSLTTMQTFEHERLRRVAQHAELRRQRRRPASAAFR